MNSLISKVIGKISRAYLRIGDRRLFRTKSVFDRNRNKIFEVYDYGETCRYRATSFWVKEPETIEWIDSFSKGDRLLDIGTNIVIYSLYAASREIPVISIEPDAQNFALLNMNIHKNSFGGLTKSYLIVLHDKTGFADLNLQKMQWGGALSCFGENYDQFEHAYDPNYSQGCYGETLDNCIKDLPNDITHIKIDVDSNENLILRGGENALSILPLKSILIELDEERSDYDSSLEIIRSCGFRLSKKTHAPMFNGSKYATTYNHIFLKVK